MSRRWTAGRAVAVLAVVASAAACGIAPSTSTAAPGALDVDLPPLAEEPSLTADELAEALPEHAPWHLGIADYVSPPWTAPWCPGEERLDPLATVDEPTDVRDGYWSGGAPSTAGGWFQLTTVRWRPADGGAASAAGWHEALREDAAGCAEAVLLDPAGVPAGASLLTATSSSPGLWVVAAATTDGPTGLRISTGVEAASAEEAGAAVAGLVATALGRVASADDLAGPLADRPASRPPVTADHLPTGPDPGVVLAQPSPASADELLAGWCPGAGPVDAAPPEQGWRTAWQEPLESGLGVPELEQRVLRFTGLGDAAGLEAAAAYSESLRAGAEGCLQQQRPLHGVVEAEPERPAPWHGADVLVTGVDEGDGTWTTTATARDGVTVLHLRARTTAPMGWSEDLALGLVGEAWVRVHAADRAPGATGGLVTPE